MCDYPACKFNNWPGSRYCQFHAPIEEKKNISLEYFNEAYFDQIGKIDTFEGFVFPGDIKFGRREFTSANFDKAIFYGKADFSDVVFSGLTNFESAIFTHGASYTHASILENASFIGAKFLNILGSVTKLETYDFNFKEINGNISFASAIFEKSQVSFKDAIFNGEIADFSNCSFRESSVDFIDTQFNCRRIEFINTKFTKGFLIFSGTKFSRGSVAFVGSKFYSQETVFGDVNFDGGSVDFAAAYFNGGRTNFIRCRFAHDVRFIGNTICDTVEMIDVDFAEKAAFLLSNPIFIQNGDTPMSITFRRVKFNPFKTFFEIFKFEKDNKQSTTLLFPYIIFRDCQLQYVYFTKVNMSYISLFRNAFFEEAFFTNSKWEHLPLKIRNKIFPSIISRRHLCYEDLYFKQVNDERNRLKEIHGEGTHTLSDFPDTHTELAELYLRLKAAADKAKDYHLASWFYYNEIEMKRLQINDNIKSKIKGKLGWLRYIIAFRLHLYNFYKYTAGYGEKPGLSFFWFLLFSIAFSSWHLINGLKVTTIDKVGGIASEKIINYDISFTLDGIRNFGQLFSDFLKALEYTLYKILPTSYLPFPSIGICPSDSGIWDFIPTLLSTVTLALMIIFTGIGLKRHFRRF